jgi:hypothetical protein
MKKNITTLALTGLLAVSLAGCAGVSANGSVDAPSKPIESAEPAPVKVETVPTEGTRENPYPAGYVVTMSDIGGNELYTVAARLVEADATASIAQANQFNELAPAGFKYIIVEYTITGLNATTPVMPGVEAYDWQIMTENGSISEQEWVVAPGATISGAPDLYEGQTYVGQAVYTVPAEAATFTFTTLGLYVSL